MKIARLIIHDITHERLIEELQSPTGTISVEISNEELTDSVDIDIINEFRQQTPVAGFLKQTFDFGAHHLKKDKVEVKLLQVSDSLQVSARQSTDISDGYAVVSNHKVLVSFIINTGKLSGEIFKSKTYEVDISKTIPAVIKSELLADFGLTVSGSWKNIKVIGACKVTVSSEDENTVFLGNEANGFIFS